MDQQATEPSVLVVVGTRPEIIKMAPVVEALEQHPSTRCTLLHTRQHYDPKLSGSFFDRLSIRPPEETLDVGSGTPAEQTAEGITGVAKVLEEHDVDAVLTQGDTNTVLATAVASSKHPVTLGHVEAGIRCGDSSMPEEVNRVVADRVSNLLFAPTRDAAENLEAEGIVDGVHVTGNTVVDACRQYAPVADVESDVLDRLGYAPGEYVVATIHRQRNTDDPDRLRRVLTTLDERSFPVILPLHPRTAAAAADVELESTGSLELVDPLDYFDFLALESSARAIVTDSGGVQEEAAILQVPCLTVRPHTERPETIEAGVNELVSPDGLSDRLDAVVQNAELHASMVGQPDLFGDGKSGKRIVDLLVDAVGADDAGPLEIEASAQD